MKFQFKIQGFQAEAVKSVVDVFAGQPRNERFTYRIDPGSSAGPGALDFFEDELFTGFANAKIELKAEKLLANINRIQSDGNIRISRELIGGGLGACSLDVEMETGTGKTYVYINTMFELNKHYGWSKFIVVVPSIAIREGVRKSFEITQEHFMERYNKKARFFVYDSKNLSEIDRFSQASDITVMIINIQAFNSSFDAKKNNSAARIINSERDEFGSRRPIDVIAANRPILVMDEPQKMGGAATQAGLARFSPLFCLNYSATHKQHHNLVYALDAIDAYNMRLVKRIEVKGFDINNLRGANSYLFLEKIEVYPDRPPRARIDFEVAYGKGIKRETRVLGAGDDLFALSKSMEQYRGYSISDIEAINGTVTFANGAILHVGDVTGDISERQLRRVQIRETIRSHLEKERELYPRGIKALSLFFIDEVAKYRKYDEEGNEANSEYGEIFEEEYAALAQEQLEACGGTPYGEYLRSIVAETTHAGYFSVDKKGHKVDSPLKARSDESDDISAYDLILKDKERLLSFESPVRFIFSHSALREGWDNPNVFQICALKHGGSSPVQKRQEVGRGLRLCVNQEGARMDGDALGDEVQEVNQLTVIASGGYKDFVADLQRGIREDLRDRPLEASAGYFIGKTLVVDGNKVTLTERQGNDIFRYLVKNDYIDENYQIAESYRAALAEGSLAPLTESCAGLEAGVHALIQGIFDENALGSMIADGNATKVYENRLNSNFYKKEFQELWSRINHKYAYTVRFDSGELVKKAVACLDKNMRVSGMQYTVTAGSQGKEWDIEALDSGAAFVSQSSRTFSLKGSGSSTVKYDLVGKVASGTGLTRRTAGAILMGIRSSTFLMFSNNPEEFISKVVSFTTEQKASAIVEHVSYSQIDGSYDTDIFATERRAELSRAYRAKKNVQDYVLADGYAKDGMSVERRFAEDMDTACEVCVYAKLPRGFYIPTPVGNYSPDWAVAFDEGKVKHIYFIAETKGTMESLNLKPIESAKIFCAKTLFEKLSGGRIKYGCVDSFKALLDMVRG